MKNLGYFLVAQQFTGIFLTAGTALTGDPGTYSGLIISGAGVLLGLTTLVYNRIGNFNIAPELRSEARLVTTGPYRWIRHPMYTAVFLTLLGLVFYKPGLGTLLGLMVASGAMIWKAKIEEQYLSDRFPSYQAYRTKTKMFIPFIC